MFLVGFYEKNEDLEEKRRKRVEYERGLFGFFI